MKAQEDETVIFKDAVILKDAVGRKLAFPIDKVKTWKGIEELIKQAFKHVDVVGPHVQEGHYDVIMCGMIVLPQVWDCWIRPGVMVEMRMWPMDKPCPAVIRDRRPMDTRNISESAMAWMQGVTKPKVVSGGNPPNPPAKHEQPLAPQQAGQAPSKPSPVSVGTNMPAEAPASLPRLGAKSPRRDLEGSTLSGNGSTLGDNKQQNTTEERKRPRKKVS
ncbi:hypothetical protein LZ32DRAFT_536333 [Colletotrichum eremochloae]|nr:hypothetical protein LZ32DRAFT_536333 [Colletotrichum eremochloae]